MQPQQPAPPSQQPGQSVPEQYDFIMNPAQPPKKSPLGGNSSLPFRILIVVGGLFVLAIIAAVLVSALGSGSKDSKEDLISAAQDQSELAHIADTATNTAVSDATKNLAINTKLTMTTHQAKLLDYMKGRGIKVNDKTLALKQDANTDMQLTDAKSASNFDPVFTEIVKRQLVGYQQDLQTAYSHVGTSGKPVLKEQYNAAQLLLTQIENNN